MICAKVLEKRWYLFTGASRGNDSDSPLLLRIGLQISVRLLKCSTYALRRDPLPHDDLLAS